MKTKFKKQKKELRFICCLRELKEYFRYRKIVKAFSHTEVWKSFHCKYSGTRKFGFIVRIYPQYIYTQDIEIIPNEKERLAKKYIAEHIAPFTDGLNRIGLFENHLTIKCQQRLGEDELKMINDFLFYEVDFAYKWRYLKTSYIVSRFFILIVLGAIALYFNEIIEFFKNII